MFELGKRYQRQRDLHDRFGGNRQSGIAPCASHPVVFLFSSPRGEEFGYLDRWVNPSEYSYTGEGQSGDMEMARGNRAIMEHEAAGRGLHLFEKVDGGYYEYLGRFRYVSHQVRQGPDVDGQSRSQLLFRLELLSGKGRSKRTPHLTLRQSRPGAAVSGLSSLAGVACGTQDGLAPPG